MKLEDLGIDPQQAIKHWSGLSGFMWKATESVHPLDSTTNTLKFRKGAYAVDYHGTSQYVHCSIGSLSNYCPDIEEPYIAKCYPERYDQNTQRVLFTLANYLHACCAYALFGLGIDRPSQLDQLFSTVINELEPVIPTSKPKV
jgi:hypothetical protein